VLEEFLLQKRAALREAARGAVASEVEAADAIPPSDPGPLTPTRPRRGQARTEEASRRRHARLVEQYEAIRRLHAAGADVADIARRVGTSRRTVYRYRNLPEPPAPKRPHRPRRQRVLTPYEPYPLLRWAEGCHNGMRLYREVREQGYAHGASNVMRFVAQLRRDEAAGQPAGAGARAKAAQVPSARRVAGLFLRRPAELHQADAAVATAYRLTQEFATLVRERGGDRVDAWLAAADACAVPALQRFATGLRADFEAVRAGLTEQWSNGPTEGLELLHFCGQLMMWSEKRRCPDATNPCAVPAGVPRRGGAPRARQRPVDRRAGGRPGGLDRGAAALAAAGRRG
jgi:hypothetical protein